MVWDSGQGMGGRWGGADGARGQPVKLNDGRCSAAGEEQRRQRF
jgi:hypothetical protein